MSLSTPQIFAAECRESRKKYLLAARQYPHNTPDREIDLDLARMYKRHEISWLKMV